MRVRTDQASWSQFVDLYGPVLYRWNRAAGMQPADAQEVVQEVLLFVHERLGSFERRRSGSFRAWLRAVALNKTRELWRRRGRDRAIGCNPDVLDALPDPRAADTLAARYAEDIFLQACQLIRSRVDETTWRIFMKVYVERVPAEQVAGMFHVSRNLVYVAQCRCLAKVRQVVDRYLDDMC